MSVVRPIDLWFAEEILPHEARFREAARRLCRHQAEAEDLVQEAFARLFASQGWQAIAHPQAYVLAMLRNIAIERMRRAAVVDLRHFVDIGQTDIGDDAPCPHRVAEGRDALARLGQAIASLPERCRVVLLRRRVAGESAKAIASDLGISLSTFEKRLARAIHLLGQADLAAELPAPAPASPPAPAAIAR